MITLIILGQITNTKTINLIRREYCINDLFSGVTFNSHHITKTL